jgi:hypoxanthine phosphoribosyltransferase
MTDGAMASEILSESEILSRVDELAAAISHDYQNRNPLFVVLLSGSVMFGSDLVRRVEVDSETDFLALNRFGEGGRIGISMDLSTPVMDRNVIIVKDVIDTGLTLGVLRRMMLDRGAASVATVTLLDKSRRRVSSVSVEYRGFEVGDEFLLGYGLDWDGRYRNLRSIWAILDMEAFVFDPFALATLIHRPVSGHWAGDNLGRWATEDST